VALTVGLTLAERSCTATVFELPGCGAEAKDRQSLLLLLPVCIAEYATWLDSHGEPTSDVAPDFDVVEEVDPADTDAADGEFCFQHDLGPATQDEMDTAIRILGYTRWDLERITIGLPDAVLDWRPPESAMAKIDAWKPGVLTIGEIIEDIAGAEGYYRTGLQDGVLPAGEPLDLASQRERTLERLSSLSDDERSRTFRPQRTWQREGSEMWTVRKVLRRMIGHERFHTAEIQQRLSWLFLGVPDFTGRGA